MMLLVDQCLNQDTIQITRMTDLKLIGILIKLSFATTDEASLSRYGPSP